MIVGRGPIGVDCILLFVVPLYVIVVSIVLLICSCCHLFDRMDYMLYSCCQ